MTTKNKRNRRSPEEMAAHYAKMAERCAARARGETINEDDSSIAKRIKTSLKLRKTALHRAEVLINGRAGTDKSPAINNIDAKIANAEQRLADMVESKRVSLDMQANLPFDIQKLESLLAALATGVEIEFPTDLYTLPGQEDQTDSQAEIKSATENDVEVTG